MSRIGAARGLAARLLALVATGGLLAVVAGAGCTSEKPAAGGGSFCAAARAAAPSCKDDPAACDGAFTSGCASLDKALAPSVLVAARDCLESGVCGATSCLGRAQSRAAPSEAHESLAASYCQTCAPDVADCERQFYAKKSKLPGGLVLPYADEVARAVEESCTSDAASCSRFAACASETAARVVGEAVGPDLADCVTSAFRQDDGTGGVPGGGPTVTTCNRDNCEGCCRDDKCEDGDSVASCGINGSACQTCSGAQECKEGVCKAPCGPSNCPGCCDGDVCLPGTETNACGSGGGECKPCTEEGSSFVCSNQQCIDASCQATCTTGCCAAGSCRPGTEATACGSGGEGCYACGAGRTCDAVTRTCVLDPNSLWDVFVSYANVPATDASGAAWDVFNGAPDPYLKALSIAGATTHRGETEHVSDSTAPVWAKTVLSGVKASTLMASLSFEVWDSDVDYDDYMGGCSVSVRAPSFGGTLQVVKCPATASSVPVEIFFRLNPRP